MLSDFKEVVKPGSAEAELLAQVDWQRIPQHVAVIMDGNGRWAAQRGKPRIFGHRAGAESVRAIVDSAARLGAKALTLYAFSTENWKRPEDEVSALMRMLISYLNKELEKVHKQEIRFQAIGRLEALSPKVRKELARAMERTAGNKEMTLSIALNYGGRAEIVDACRAAAEKALQNGGGTESITEETIAENLYTHGLPEVDLMIRTSGEFRISNFLLWQLAYSEIYVTPTFFPDFRLKNFLEAVIDFQKRERRFGGLAPKMSEPKATAK
jgi:undecaprenyl diphosphate synthase